MEKLNNMKQISSKSKRKSKKKSKDDYTRILDDDSLLNYDDHLSYDFELEKKKLTENHPNFYVIKKDKKKKTRKKKKKHNYPVHPRTGIRLDNHLTDVPIPRLVGKTSKSLNKFLDDIFNTITAYKLYD